MGRPKGSKNKRTKGIPPEIAAQLDFKDPAEVLSQVYSMPFDQLKRMMRSKAGATALAMKVRAAEIAMPYQHSKMPVKVEVDETKLPTLVVYAGQHQLQQNQALIKDAKASVVLEASYSEGKHDQDQ